LREILTKYFIAVMQLFVDTLSPPVQSVLCWFACSAKRDSRKRKVDVITALKYLALKVLVVTMKVGEILSKERPT